MLSISLLLREKAMAPLVIYIEGKLREALAGPALYAVVVALNKYLTR